MTRGRPTVAFGSAEERDAQKRSIMGRIAAQKCDLSVITDEDHRDVGAFSPTLKSHSLLSIVQRVPMNGTPGQA